jgi:hypothetical protein
VVTRVFALRDYPVLLLVVIVPAFYACAELGYRFGESRASDTRAREQIAVLRDQVSILLSLVLGFTLALATSRYDDRRHELVDETDAIGTARLRASFAPEAEQKEIDQIFDRYVDARIAFTNAGVDEKALARAHTDSVALHQELWKHATAAARAQPSPITALFVQSVNSVISIEDRRIAAIENRIPRPTWLLIAILGMFSALTIGLTMRKRSLKTMLLPAVTFALVAMLIADLDTPGTGLIHGDDRSLQRLKH